MAEHVTSACIRHAAENAASYVMYTVRNNTLHALPVQPLAADEGPLDLGELQRGAKSKAHVNRGAGGGFLSSMRAAMRPAAGQLATTGAARTIEGGAVLVAAPPGQTTIVLQMPRGNLEGESRRACGSNRFFMPPADLMNGQGIQGTAEDLAGPIICLGILLLYCCCYYYIYIYISYYY